MGIATSQIYLMQKFNREIALPKVTNAVDDTLNMTLVTRLEKDLRKSERFAGSGNWARKIFIHSA